MKLSKILFAVSAITAVLGLANVGGPGFSGFSQGIAAVMFLVGFIFRTIARAEAPVS